MSGPYVTYNLTKRAKRLIMNAKVLKNGKKDDL